jgi:hypothetical protein
MEVSAMRTMSPAKVAASSANSRWAPAGASLLAVMIAEPLATVRLSMLEKPLMVPGKTVPGVIKCLSEPSGCNKLRYQCPNAFMEARTWVLPSEAAKTIV